MQAGKSKKLYEYALPGQDLSPREKEMLILVSKGYSTLEAGKILGIKYHTASQHLQAAFYKLEVHTQAAAVARALREGIIK